MERKSRLSTTLSKLVFSHFPTQALLALKKKKYQEKKLDEIIGMLQNVEEMVSHLFSITLLLYPSHLNLQINSIDFAIREKEVFEALKLGNQVLQELNRGEREGDEKLRTFLKSFV